ncbi:hypothetical protein [Roseibacillus ishigakijimensis]|uniref:Uncharacterized protein n=1 Tax=Roseibacillus ishigakijimensis TaxID=454146 RepID=A0A934VMF3_9BACT|nr:hypothetical protein [Roseibacillus ishigakijimensis]MBK1835699.1 hypothetical protein [Roseibacillus ishigakijimensis]
MKTHLLTLALVLVFPFVVLADLGWTHRAEEGEDASSHHYYFYKSSGESVGHVRSVWNGGAQNQPIVVDYFIDGSDILIRESSGTRNEVSDLIAGREAKLTVVREYKITGRHAKAMLLAPDPDKPLSADQRRDLANLIYLLAKHRKPIE